MKALTRIAVLGNAVYVLWIVYNGIDEWGKPIGAVEAVSYIGLVVLLILNIVLLTRWR